MGFENYGISIIQGKRRGGCLVRFTPCLRYTQLDNTNAGRTVNFESHNLKSSYGKKVCNLCFGNVSYKNVK